MAPWSWDVEPEDPDREVNPIILQFMAKSTLRAVLSDKNALKANMDKRGMDVNAPRQELTDIMFSQLKEERLARAKELQRQFLTFLMENNGDHTELLKNVFVSFARAVKEQKEEKAAMINLLAKPGKSEGWKKLKTAKSQPDFGRLMKGLKRGQTETAAPGSLVGSSVQVLDSRDPRSKRTGLTIKCESAKGLAWELSDGTFLTKEHQGTRWALLTAAKPDPVSEQSPMTSLQSLSARSSSTGTIRRRPSISELGRLDAKVPRPASRSGRKLPRP